MENFPPKTCTIDQLVRHPKSVAAAKAGTKTQQRRNGIYAYPGEKFELEGQGFVLTKLERRKLKEMTDDDARSEGYPNLEVYRQIIISMHKGMTWNEEALVWVHHFERDQNSQA